MDWPQLAHFNAFDWVVVVVLVLSGLLSLWRGFVREAIALGGWVLAFILANLFAISVAEVFGDFIANRTGRYVVAWSLVFVAVLVSVYFVAKLVSKLISASGLGVLDRLLGTVFGVLRGVLLIMALVFVVRKIIPESEQTLLLESEFMPHIDLLLGWSTRMFEQFQALDSGSFTL